MKQITIKQGDQGSLGVIIRMNGESLALGNLLLVEFMLGPRIRKLWKADGTGDVEYADGRFLFSYTQEETLALPAGITLPLDVRVKFVGDNVEGPKNKPCMVKIIDAQSTEVL